MGQSPLFNYVRNRNRSRKPTRIVRTSDTLKSSVPIIPTASAKDMYLYSLGEEVYIIGGGPSLKHFNFNVLRNKITIAANKSIFDIPSPDYFISVDYTFLRKVKKYSFSTINAKKFFVADFSHPDLVEIDGQIIDKRFNLVYNLREYDRVIKAQKFLGIGYSFEDFNAGRNSGYCALQLAVILGFKKIYLLGIDLGNQKDTHYHEGYGQSRSIFESKLDEYYEYFLIGLEQLIHERPDIQVISCSKISRLNDIISYCPVEEVLK